MELFGINVFIPKKGKLSFSDIERESSPIIDAKNNCVC